MAVMKDGKWIGRPTNAQKRSEQLQQVPQADVKAIARAAHTFLNRYDAAGRGRRMAAWNPPQKGPNTALAGLEKLRSRAQDSVRNDWASESGATKWATALIGIGITPRFKRIKSPTRRQEINDLFIDFSRQIDADCVLDYFGQQTLVARQAFADGEIFARARWRYPDEGLPVPLQVQLLEAAMVPLLDAESGYSKLPQGHTIRSGIEFNKRGKRVAYWVYKQHPDDTQNAMQIGEDALVRVAASEMTHIYFPSRPGALRGVSQLAPILTRLRDTGDYEDAVLTRQKIANLFVAFIKRSLPTLDPSDPLYGALTGTAAELAQAGVVPGSDAAADAGTPLLPMSPGLMQELEEGQEVQFANPPEAGTRQPEYLRTLNLGTSAAMGLPYEVHTGDIREISDRTLRIIINEFRRLAQQRQWQMVIPQFCQRVVDWFTDAAVLQGAISLSEFDDVRRVEHQPHGWEHIHPVQDPQGKQIEVEAGFRSRSSVIAERGDDPDAVDAERAADLQREKDLDLWVDPNPAPPAPTEPEEDEDPPRDDPDEGPNADLFREVRALSTTVARIDGAVHMKPAPVAPAPAPVQDPGVTNLLAALATRVSEPQPAPQVTVHAQFPPAPAPAPTPVPKAAPRVRKVPQRDAQGLLMSVLKYEDDRLVARIIPVRDAQGFVTEFAEESC